MFLSRQNGLQPAMALSCTRLHQRLIWYNSYKHDMV